MPKILVVEDNELNRDMLSRRLSKRGYDVDVATDGAQGIELARSMQPDLIVMDVGLPVVDGLEATRQLKAEARTSPIPIVALTANAMPGDQEKALAAGCEAYDTKPVDIARLLEKIEALLSGGASVT
jgi:two-component system, cell cycle response regulator DivK